MFYGIVGNGNRHNTDITVNGGKYVGGIAGQGYSSIKNCTVENSAIDGKYKVGGLTGQLNTEKVTIYATGNTVKNSSVTCKEVMSGNTATIGIFIGYKNEPSGAITVNTNTATNVTGATKDIGNVD